MTEPHDQKAEEMLISCVLLDNGHTLRRALKAGISFASFYFEPHQHIFGAAAELLRDGDQISYESVGLRLSKNREKFEAVGGWTGLGEFKAETTAHVVAAIRTVRELEQRAEAINRARSFIEHAEKGSETELLKDISKRLSESFDEEESGAQPRPITSYSYPSDDDPNMLLGSEDYLGRGGGLLFVSHAGAGKSSAAMNACMMWSLGRAWMQIKSHQPRKTLIIQAEDSDRYIGKIFASFAHVNQLSEADLELLTNNCIIVRLKGVSGPAFFAQLKALTEEHRPDLVVINPIYLYAEGDITRSEFAQPFLLGLDAVNKEERFAYILIHHTGKPQAKGNNGKRAEVEDWESAYMGFGSSYLANWPRATMLLEPVSGQPGSYLIKLGKGGYNAGVTKEVPQGAGVRHEPITRISIRHSKARMQVNGKDRPVFYWEMDDSAPAPATETKRSGRPPAYDIKDFYRWIPASRDTAKPAPQIFRDTNNATGISDNGFKKLIFRASQEGHVILAEIPNKGSCYYRASDSGSNGAHPN